MRCWKLPICALAKRRVAEACAPSTPMTSASRVGSGRRATSISTVAGAEVANALASVKVTVARPEKEAAGVKVSSYVPPLPAIVAVPEDAGRTETSVAAVNGPPLAPAVRSTTTGVPAIALTCRETATGSGLTVTVAMIGADAPNALLKV
jgi:hypothetical protein